MDPCQIQVGLFEGIVVKLFRSISQIPLRLTFLAKLKFHTLCVQSLGCDKTEYFYLGLQIFLARGNF